jgi:hypothetical protein
MNHNVVRTPRIRIKTTWVALLAYCLSGGIGLPADDAPRRLLFSGITWHDKRELDNGTKLNMYNLGIGYERDYFKAYKKRYYTYHVMLLYDSNKKPYVYLAGSESIRFHQPRFDVSIGLAGFVGIKYIRHNSDGYKYSPIIGLAPTSSFYISDYTLNFAYIPGIDFGDYKTIGFLYLYAGWEF